MKKHKKKTTKKKHTAKAVKKPGSLAWLSNWFNKRKPKRLPQRYFWLEILVFCLVAAFGALTLQASGTNSDNAWNYAAAWDFFKQNPMIAVYNYILIFSIGLLCAGLLGNVITGSMLFGLLIGVASFANYQKVVARNQPIFPEELGLIRNLKTMLQIIDGKAAILIIIAVIASLSLLIVVQHYLARYYFFTRQIKWILRSCSLFFPVLLLALFCNINQQEAWASKRLMHAGIEMNQYNQVFNYQVNGLVLGFCYNVRGEAIEKPDGYSKKAIEEIVARYQAKSLEQNKNAQKDPDMSVIYILSESFTDPMTLNDYYELNQDPIPFTRKLMGQYPAGYALVPEYGGGTANTEYEALTSLSNYFISGIPFQNLVPKIAELPSVAKYFLDYGYETMALHPNGVDMYRRDKTYPNLGIEAFDGIGSLNHTDTLYEGAFVSDQSLFANIYEKLTADTSKKFIHAVTIQNHQPFVPDSYPESDLTITTKVTLEKDKRQAMESYVAGLERSDQAMQELIEKLASLDQKVALVFWGDHYPGDGLYSGLLNEEALKLRQTPFFIYANFPVTDKDLGTQSLNYLSYDLLSELNLPLTPYYALLGDLQSQLPGLTEEKILDATGQLISNDAIEDIQAFKDYFMIQYDLIKGRKYSVELDFYQVS